MLVGDYDSWYYFSIINFDVIKPNLGYLYTEYETTNRPKVKNLGMNVKVKGKNKANPVYLSAGQIIKIGAYGQQSSIERYSHCTRGKTMALEQNINYVLSFNKVTSNKKYCLL